MNLFGLVALIALIWTVTAGILWITEVVMHHYDLLD